MEERNQSGEAQADMPPENIDSGDKNDSAPIELSAAESENRLFETIAVMASRFAGPLPHPDHFKQYAEISPEYGERIFAMAERAQAHIHEMDMETLAQRRRLVESQIARSEYGQRSARYIGFAALAVALLIALFAGPVAGPICGAIFGLGGIGSLVWAYMRGSERDSRVKNPIPDNEQEGTER